MNDNYKGFLKRLIQEKDSLLNDFETESSGVEKNTILVSVGAVEKLLKLSEEAMSLHNTIMCSIESYKEHKRHTSDFKMIQEDVLNLGSFIFKEQRQIIEMKKIPVCKVFHSFKTLVRNYGRENNKKVEMSVDGEDLMVDISVAKVLGKALGHIINNSLIHGLESVNERKKLGKPETGSISVRCFEAQSNIVVEVEDDGCGFDRKKIISSAVLKKLYNEEDLVSMSEDELLNVVLRPGLATTKEVPCMLGQSVGMPTVKSVVEKLGGDVDLFNNPGKGCMVKIKFPAPHFVDIVNFLKVKVSDHYYGIPSSSVLEVVKCNNNCDGSIVVHDLEGSLLLAYYDRLIPLVHLGRYLDSATGSIKDVDDIVVVRSESYFYGLIVDGICEMEEMVVKKVNGDIVNRTYYSGAVLTGEGNVNLVLDVDEVGRGCKIKKYDGGMDQGIHGNVMQSVPKKFLHFDLENHDNYAISLDDIFRIESVSVENIDYTGNSATIPYQEKKIPLIWVENALGLCRNKVLKNHLGRSRNVNVLLVRRERKHFGLLVDKIKGIKGATSAMDTNIRDRWGISGVVILKDMIASVINTEFLLESGVKDSEPHKSLVA